MTAARAIASAPDTRPAQESHQPSFRFYDNRQKYLLFVNTCAEKWAVAERVAKELPALNGTDEPLRVFDAGVGDGTVLTRVLRAMHSAFPDRAFYVVGKEASVEDVRLTLEKIADRFLEHPQMVLILTNLYYKEAPWLTPHGKELVWKEVALSGSTARDFELQIGGLHGFLNASWRTAINASGNLAHQTPTALVIYRQDQSRAMQAILPKRGDGRADYDLVIASQPYRLRAGIDFKASKVLAPLARSLRPGGQLLAVHSRGGDPGQEILQGVWPGEDPFLHDRHALLAATRAALGPDAKDLAFDAQSDETALFRYAMHALPDEIEHSIGTSTVFAAWNAAVYVGQIEESRLETALSSHRYLDVTREVLRKHGGLWFWDECFVIRRPA